MSKICIGIPVLNRVDLLKKCLASIDYPAQIIVINNNTVDKAANDELYALRDNKDIYVHSGRYNLGVAASWNKIIQMAMGWGYDKVYVGANDCVLLPGTLKAFETLDMGDKDDVMWHICYFSFWCMHMRSIPRVGWFDENFYPAYREDQDYVYRCRLAGVNRYYVPKCSRKGFPNVDLPEAGGVHSGSQTISSDPRYKKKNKETHHKWNTSHYKLKWGGLPGKERYKTPYNGKYGPQTDLRFWPDPGNSIVARDWDKGVPRVRGGG